MNSGRIGTGVGRALAAGAVEFAATAGYRYIMPDTLPGTQAAIALYQAPVFEPMAACGSDILPGMRCFGKYLGCTNGRGAASAWPAS